MSTARTDRIGPDDQRYHSIVQKRFNKRFLANPDYVRLADSTEEVVDAEFSEVDDENKG